jgi:hypothetical protein
MPGGTNRNEHLIGAGFRAWDVAHLKRVDAAVIIDLDCFHQPHVVGVPLLHVVQIVLRGRVRSHPRKA